MKSAIFIIILGLCAFGGHTYLNKLQDEKEVLETRLQEYVVQERQWQKQVKEHDKQLKKLQESLEKAQQAAEEVAVLPETEVVSGPRLRADGSVAVIQTAPATPVEARALEVAEMIADTQQELADLEQSYRLRDQELAAEISRGEEAKVRVSRERVQTHTGSIRLSRAETDKLEADRQQRLNAINAKLAILQRQLASNREGYYNKRQEQRNNLSLLQREQQMLNRRQ